MNTHIREFSTQLLALYDEIGKTFSGYQTSSGLTCISGCGRCCLNPEVEASVWEMIPMALKLYDEGKAEFWFDELTNHPKESCVMYVKTSSDGIQGHCGQYQTRPSLCRLFGASGYKNKTGKTELSLCKYIREEKTELAKLVEANLSNALPPLMSEYSYRLLHLHPELITQRLPINEALLEALKKIMMILSYESLE